MPNPAGPRYYAYNPSLGRLRLLRADGEPVTDEAEAIAEAAALPRADSLTREEGPPRKPTSVTIIWERDPKHASPAADLESGSSEGDTVNRVAVAMFDMTTMGVGSFAFLATGTTRDEAIDNVLDAWHAHAEQYGSDPDLITDEDVTVVEGPLGAAFRDGKQII